MTVMKSAEGYAAVDSLPVSPAKTSESKKKKISDISDVPRILLVERTHLHKVVVVQDVLQFVVRVEDLSAVAPLHAEPHVLLSPIRTSPGFMVPPQGAGPQRVDGGGGPAAGDPEPLAPYAHRQQAHLERRHLTKLQLGAAF